MFIINSNAIENEFSKTGWQHDYEKYCKIMQDIDKATKSDINFANGFAKTMNIVWLFCRSNADIVNNYFTMRSILCQANTTPEDFEYGVFGSICSGAMSLDGFSKEETEKQMSTLTSFGYMPAVTKIVSNEPYTNITFIDGSKVTVKADENSKFDAKTGVFIALLKKAMGSCNLQHIFKLLSDIDKPETPADNSNSKPVSEPNPEFEGDDGTMQYESVDDWYKDWYEPEKSADNIDSKTVSESNSEFEDDDGNMQYESVDDWYKDWNASKTSNE